jgi:hypothetical protein
MNVSGMLHRLIVFNRTEFNDCVKFQIGLSIVATGSLPVAPQQQASFPLLRFSARGLRRSFAGF